MKSKFLLLTTMLASVGFAFAQQTVTRSGITYEILQGENNIEITEKGEVVEEKPVNITYSQNDGIMIQDETYKYISNQERKVNVKAIAITDPSKITAGQQITGWQAAAPRPQTVLIENYETSIGDFGSSPMTNGTTEYVVDTNNEKYKVYEKVCLKAKESNKFSSNIFKGNEISAQYDSRGAAIHQDLYYYKHFMIQEMNFGGQIYRVQIDIFYTIENTNGGIYEKTELTNCNDFYTPTEIADDIKWNVTTSGKTGVVTGVVNNARIAEAVARGERNFDFTGATILGEVNIDVPANKLAYFTKNVTECSGNNIVVGTMCENYIVDDNGQEIYVKKGFTAENATYKRTFTAGAFGTLALPFTAVSTGDLFTKQARLTGYDNVANKISCTTAETIAPNVPYLFEAKADADEINEINASVVPTGNPTSEVCNGLQLIGTYAPISGSALTNNYIFSTTGVIGRLNVNSTLKPGRCYFKYSGASSNAKISEATIEIMDEEGSIVDFIAPNLDGEEATDIDGVITNSNVVSVQYISVNGQVSNEPVKGMNLVKKTYADGTVETSKVAF